MKENPTLQTHNSRKITILASCLALTAGCATVEGTTVSIKPAQAAKLTPASQFPRVPGRVLVKVRSGFGTRSIQGLMGSLSLPNHLVAKTQAGESEEAAALRLMRDPAVAFAEPDYIYHSFGDIHTGKTLADTLHVSYMPNNPRLQELWGHFKIGAPGAWDITKGSPDIKVAVVDTGVDYNHEVFSDGRVIKGPNFADNNDDPMDDMGHGTHVAGTIGAAGDTGKGTVGIAYKTTIIAIKVLGKDGSGSVEGIANGITKAVDMGARVINLSLGGPESSQVLQDAVDYAINKNVLVVAAAGNSGNEEIDYPAAFPNVLSVGATDRDDNRASFSNYGSYVKVAAPGVDILSSSEGDYKVHSGTSMASPHVAGAAALLLAYKPDLKPDQVAQILANTGEPTSGFTNGTVNRINIQKALASFAGSKPAPSPTPPPSANLTISDIALPTLGPTSATLTWQTSKVADGQVQYTTDYYYQFGYWWRQSESAGPSQSHEVNLNGLKPSTAYYVRMRSATSDSNATTSDLFEIDTPAS